MDTFLFEVEEIMPPLPQFGPVLFPGIKFDGPVLNAGAPLVLLLPDGTRIDTFLRSFPLINTGRHYRGFLAVELPKSIKVEQIPQGTQVWLTTV